jgi:hypothetical protein
VLFASSRYFNNKKKRLYNGTVCCSHLVDFLIHHIYYISLCLLARVCAEVTELSTNKQHTLHYISLCLLTHTLYIIYRKKKRLNNGTVCCSHLIDFLIHHIYYISLCLLARVCVAVTELRTNKQHTLLQISLPIITYIIYIIYRKKI